MRAKANDCYACDVQYGGKLIIENVTYAGNISAVYAHEGSVEIKGGKFSIIQLDAQEHPYAYMLNCFDANYRNGTASIQVTGGSSENFDPANCAAEGKGTCFVPSGYTTPKALDTPVPNGTYTRVEVQRQQRRRIWSQP